MNLRRLMGLAVWFLSACAPTLAGQLRTPDGVALKSSEGRVNVTPLATGRHQQSLVMRVDGAGRFVTKQKLAGGDYLVEVLVPGYAPKSQKINPATTQQLDLTLQPLAAAPIHATPANQGDGAGASRGGGGATLQPPAL